MGDSEKSFDEVLEEAKKVVSSITQHDKDTYEVPNPRVPEIEKMRELQYRFNETIGVYLTACLKYGQDKLDEEQFKEFEVCTYLYKRLRKAQFDVHDDYMEAIYLEKTFDRYDEFKKQKPKYGRMPAQKVIRAFENRTEDDRRETRIKKMEKRTGKKHTERQRGSLKTQYTLDPVPRAAREARRRNEKIWGFKAEEKMNGY